MRWLVVVGIAACTAEEGGPTGDTGAPGPEVRELTVDVEGGAYVDLLEGRALGLSAAEADGDEGWHLALTGPEVFSNGGSSGPGLCALGLLAEPGTDDVAALEGALGAPPAWVADRRVDAFGQGWHSYNPTNGIFTAVPDVGYLVRGGEGTSYARLRFTALDFPSRENEGVQSFTITLDVQGAGKATFADTPVAFTGAIGGAGGDLCFDFDAAATVPCAGTSWDVLLGFEDRNFYMRPNGGISGDGQGGVFGPLAWDAVGAYASATTDPDGADLTDRYEADDERSLVHDEPWFTGGELAPTYRIYGLDTDGADDAAPRVAFQILSLDGARLTLRTRRLRADEAR